MPRRFTIPALLLAALAALFAVLPAATRQTGAPPAATVRGAFHVHSDRSDGSGSVAEIAAAAAEAGLQFVILTDHGDATRAPDAPAYRSGVLTIDGVELNTTGGHYATVGLPAAPYPIAGTPDDVIEDVHRLGGFGFAAHPGSPRPSLSWQDWDAPIDGLEWLNGDSEWRDEPRLPIARALVTYFFRAPQTIALLLDRPAAVLERWDALARTRRVVGIAGADAHARLGLRQRTDPDVSGVHVPFPGYAPTFRAFSNHVVLEAPLSGDAGEDAARLLDAMRRGRIYSVIDALASPGSLRFSATSGGATAVLGGTLDIDGEVVLHASASAPPGATLVLLRNGSAVGQVTDGPLEINAGSEAAVYRVEAHLPGAPGGPPVPWMVSNPIYVGQAPAPRPSVPAEPVSRIPARAAEATAEHAPNDTSSIVIASPQDDRARRFAGDPEITWTFALSGGVPSGQFAAITVPVSGLEAFERVRFRVSAPAPMRAWVQLRAPVGDTERWGRTFYVDAQPRLIDVAFATFNAIGPTSSERPPIDRVDSLLFVVDTLNTLPGKGGAMTISEIGFVK
jgi:hypothetical protein